MEDPTKIIKLNWAYKKVHNVEWALENSQTRLGRREKQIRLLVDTINELLGCIVKRDLDMYGLDWAYKTVDEVKLALWNIEPRPEPACLRQIYQPMNTIESVEKASEQISL